MINFQILVFLLKYGTMFMVCVPDRANYFYFWKNKNKNKTIKKTYGSPIKVEDFII